MATDKTTTTEKTTAYHHGDLPDALRAATAELVAERGPSGFSLREVARRAGVSHAAPAHHFGDSQGLLTSVAIEGFDVLNQAFAEASERHDDPAERMTALGLAYVGVARSHRGHFEVMWADGLLSADHPELKERSMLAYGYLVECMVAVAETYNPELDVTRAALLTWSSVHGLAMLDCAGPLSGKTDMGFIDDLEDQIEHFTRYMIWGYASR